MNYKKAIVNLKFKSNLSMESIGEVSKEKNQMLKDTKGLICLFCYTNRETKTIGGTFIFRNIEFAQQYIGKFLTEGFGPRYGIIPMTLKIDIGTIEEEIIGAG
ncbi:hypothetical protein ACWGOQ_0006925 [Aquimarina sp. M1]